MCEAFCQYLLPRLFNEIGNDLLLNIDWKKIMQQALETFDFFFNNTFRPTKEGQPISEGITYCELLDALQN